MARQIVAALDATHEMKSSTASPQPANIKITPTGVVKLLDFGRHLVVVQHPAARRWPPAAAEAARGHDCRHGGLHEPRAGARAAR